MIIFWTVFFLVSNIVHEFLFKIIKHVLLLNVKSSLFPRLFLESESVNMKLNWKATGVFDGLEKYSWDVYQQIHFNLWIMTKKEIYVMNSWNFPHRTLNSLKFHRNVQTERRIILDMSLNPWKWVSFLETRVN